MEKPDTLNTKISMSKNKRSVLGIVIMAGIAVAVASSLETRVEWIAAFCGMIGDGCRDTVQYRMFGIPIPWLGIGYYLSLGLVWLSRPRLLFHAVMAGLGVEAALVVILIQMKLPCVLCIANLLVMTALAALVFDPRRLSETAAAGLAFFLLSNTMISHAHAVKQGGAKERSPAVLADVAGETVSRDEIEGPLATRIYKLEKTIHDMKQMALAGRIARIILEKEAREKNITADELRAELTGHLPPVSRAEVDYIFKSKTYRRQGIRGRNGEEVRAGIKSWLEKKRADRQILDHTLGLWDKYGVSVALEKPRFPVAGVVIEGSPVQGPETAAVTVVEFSDYLCPSCRANHDTVKKIKEKYKGRIRWVFRDFPLKIHPGARELALAARCAGDQGLFWEYQDRLFEGEEKPTPEDALKIAAQMHLNPEKFGACMADEDRLDRLDRETGDAFESGINATPTIIVNGRVMTGAASFEALSALIDRALDEAA
ncbi:MAG: thioredoxin domain-containing protein [Desulfobacter sp.]|nr:MAG: thioredoxin domain-containing protein [Desulfobacter sp.]